MPQLVKGGKYVFGWSKVGDQGEIVIPLEALEEYNLTTDGNVILMPGSKTSGGFGLTTVESLKRSSFSALLDENPQLAEFQVSKGEAIDIGGKTYCWTKLCDGHIALPVETLEKFGVKPGARLLSVRGSYLAIGFVVRGPIIEAAKTHPEIEIFEI